MKLQLILMAICSSLAYCDVSSNGNRTGLIHYKVLMMPEVPFLFVNSNGTFTGYSVDLMDRLAVALNFTYEICLPLDGKYGIFENGSWNGMMKEILEGRGDMISGAFTITSDRSSYIDFTVPYYGFNGMTIIMKREKQTVSLFLFANVFNWKIWVSVAAIVLGMGILVFIMEKFSPYSSRNTDYKLVKDSQIKFNFRESMWLCLGTITLAGAEYPPYTISTRVLLSGFWIFSAILIATYQANLSAYFTISRLDSNIGSLQELANQNKIKYSYVAGTSVQMYFEEMKAIENNFYEFWKLSSTLPQKIFADSDTAKASPVSDAFFGNLKYRSLWEFPLSNTYTTLNERINAVGSFESTANGIEKILNATADEPFALISEYPIAVYEINRNCDLKLVGNQFSSRPYAIGVKKNSSLKAKLSEILLGLQRDLVLDALKVKWWGTSGLKCKSVTSTESAAIKLDSIGGIFITMAGALLLSMIIFFIDMINQNVFLNDKIKSHKCVTHTEELKVHNGKPKSSYT